MTERIVNKILIANRGEIAVRIARTCRDMGIRSVAVFSDVDESALHVEVADEAYALGGKTAAESYLNQERILQIANDARVDAIHPGYGFLSENPAFASVVEQAGLVFIGPTSEAIRTIGDKTEARKIARQCGVPILPGSGDAILTEEEGLQNAQAAGFPILLKAAAGGGGKGMRIVSAESEFSSAFRSAQSEAKASFGDLRVFLEKYFESSHHIEVQILGDSFGNVVHLGERECSIQRRHQKVVEETPSPIMTPELRSRMTDAAIRLATAVRYRSAGTVEFLVDSERNFYFLEVNTRLQVEHPVTEVVTGLDLVREQIEIARGKRLSFVQHDVQWRGHAIECRVYAEDPLNNFLPSTGRLVRYRVPEGSRVRVDNGFCEGGVVSSFYDSMLAKVITWGRDRGEALGAMRRALKEFMVVGVETTIPFCEFVMSDEDFVGGDYRTDFVNRRSFAQAYGMQMREELLHVALAATLLVEGNLLSMQPKSDGLETTSRWKALRTETYRS